MEKRKRDFLLSTFYQKPFPVFLLLEFMEFLILVCWNSDISEIKQKTKTNVMLKENAFLKFLI